MLDRKGKRFGPRPVFVFARAMCRNRNGSRNDAFGTWLASRVLFSYWDIRLTADGLAIPRTIASAEYREVCSGNLKDLLPAVLSRDGKGPGTRAAGDFVAWRLPVGYDKGPNHFTYMITFRLPKSSLILKYFTSGHKICVHRMQSSIQFYYYPHELL
jgi:hypothetical protein